MKPESVTIQNLEAAFAGESMAHIKYRYFAKLARAAGDEATARVQTRAPDTLLAFWASRRGSPPECEFPWEAIDDRYPPHLLEQLEHAQNFSESMHGAVLLYNLLLAEKSARATWVDTYRTALNEWGDLMASRTSAISRWDRPRFWDIVLGVNPRVPRLTRLFVEQWLELALEAARRRHLADDAAARELIRTREHFLKRGQARLENQRALDLWKGAAGTGRLNFRWTIAQSHLREIHTGLRAP